MFCMNEHAPGGLLSTLLLHPLDTLKIRSAAGRGNASTTLRLLARCFLFLILFLFLFSFSFSSPHNR